MPPDLAALLARHQAALHAFIRLNAGPHILARESVSDILQSALLALARRGEGFEFRGEKALVKWIHVAVLRKIQDHGKHVRRQRRDSGHETPLHGTSVDHEILAAYRRVFTPSQEAAAHEEVARIERIFQQLHDGDREVITLARFADLSYAEIGEHQGRTVDAVRMHLHRALARLSVLLVSGSSPHCEQTDRFST